MPRLASFAAPMGLMAALSMAVTPAMAADVPLAPAHSAYASAGILTGEAINAHGWRGYRYRDRVDAGDVLAGVLIIGGIAAIANAASKSSRNRDYRDDRYRDDYRYRSSDNRANYRRGESRYTSGSGIDNAVNMCVGAIERDVRVDSVDSVERDSSGWLVTGTIYNGEGFSCRIDGNGRVNGINFGRGTATPYSGAAADRQWGDDRYRQAWARVDNVGAAVVSPSASDPQPPYPGGPIEGDLSDD